MPRLSSNHRENNFELGCFLNNHLHRQNQEIVLNQQRLKHMHAKAMKTLFKSNLKTGNWLRTGWLVFSTRLQS